MIVGNSKKWKANLIDIDSLVFNCICRVWPIVVRNLSKFDREDEITQRLVDVLRDDKGVSSYGFLVPHHKLRKEDTHGDYTTKGILDMALFLDQDHQKYIAYECKKLNRLDKLTGKRTGSLAGPYVTEGMIRYVTAKYSEQLQYGCMIGYVMDGDVDFIINQLKVAILKRKTDLKLNQDDVIFTNQTHFCSKTKHFRKNNSSEFQIRHRLLPFPIEK